MALPKIQSCCGCFSLKTGTIIIASINLTISLVFSLLCIGIMVSADVMVAYLVTYLDNEEPNWDQSIDRNMIPTVLCVAAIVMLAITALCLVFPSCLIHGARTGNVCLMKPWIILTAIGLILDICNILTAIFTLNIADVVFSLLYWIVGAYFLLVVWSHKAEVEEAQFLSQDLGLGHYNKGMVMKA